MRILHTADLHLGRQFNGLSLEADHQVILDQIVSAILTHRPDVFIIAGDIFDRAAPPASAIRQCNAFLSRVRQETSTSVVIIAGNHDSSDRIGAMSVMTDAQRALINGPLDTGETPLVLHDADGPVVISALPFGYEFAARECFGDLTIASPEDVMRAQIAAARRHLPDGARWVVVAHAFVAGASNSEGERALTRVGGIETVSTEVFEGAHYVALGHLHRPQSVGAPHIRYAGAPLPFGFDEVGDTKSMSLIDMDAAGDVSIQTLPFAPLRGLKVLRGTMDEITRNSPSQDFVKVVLTDETPVIDPMKRLREIFPNVCQLSYARFERAPENKTAANIVNRTQDPISLIDDFLRYVRDRELNDAERALAASVLHGLQHEEASE